MALLKDLTVFGATNLISYTFADNIFSNGFHHNDHDNDNGILLAGGGWSLISDLSVENAINSTKITVTQDTTTDTDFPLVFTTPDNNTGYKDLYKTYNNIYWNPSKQSFAHGKNAVANGLQSHAEGYYTVASYICAHSEGALTISYAYSHAEGCLSYALGTYVHAEGYQTKAFDYYSHAEGENTTSSGEASHAEGDHTIASGNYSHTEGNWTTASEDCSHAEGNGTTASGYVSHAEGSDTTASGDYSHAEGEDTTSSGVGSHAEGSESIASGRYSHAENTCTTASGVASHAEGSDSIASGDYSHAEGEDTTASGRYSHAEGYETTALGYYSHTSGCSTIANNSYEFAIGRFNVSNVDTRFSIGDGTADNDRKNIFEVKTSGYVYGQGFHHTSHDNDNSVLLAGGGWKLISALKNDEIISFTQSLTVTENWMDTGIIIDNYNFPEGDGTYVIQINASALDNSTDLYDRYYSGIMSIYTSMTSGTNSDEIVLHNASKGNIKRLYLRTVQQSDSYYKLQIAAEKNYSTSYVLVFKFRKLI